MLGFERQVVDHLVTTPDPDRRAAVHRWVAGSLADMPEHLRVGVYAESVALAAVARLLRAGRRPSDDDVARAVQILDVSPIALLRQYVRLFRSLVLFAEQELAGQKPGA
ncbi:MAG TPA: hypothetical protein VFZ83_04775 [Acidimicrobiia bacterium]|nr:hypothetical protein [Acidimicrobiia bacterium]